MKLLGWMHRKFRQNSAEPLKDLLIGRVSLDEHYQTRTQFSRNVIKQKDQFAYWKSFASLEENNKEEEETEEPISELFTNWNHGLLAIGTLGSDQPENETQIPHFDLENITENETEVTANDIRLINDELEKVLGEESCESGRNSHVSVNVKMPENGETHGQVCPLQGYLFGSPIELPVKRDSRTSLGELFQRSKAAEQSCGLPEIGKSVKNKGLYSKNEEKKQPEGEKSGVHLVKKMLKRRPRNTPPDSENKIHKLLNMFHKKVHPESSTFAKKPTKAHMKEEIKNNTTYEEDADDIEGHAHLHDALMIPHRTMPKGGILRRNCNLNPSPFALSGSDSSGIREYWIKTDADYLVLEL